MDIHERDTESRSAIQQALQLRAEIDSFQNRWPTQEPRRLEEEPMPSFSWQQLERQLFDLAATPAQADLAEHLVSATRKLSRFKPPEMVLREILCLTWVLLDENFRPGEEVEDSMS
ncbi:MAG TPA: hypothetical protein VIO94_01600 [Phenylobacterium sp.]